MNEGLITVRYAKALYELASEDRVQDKIVEDIKFLLDCINFSDELKLLLETPQIKVEDKLRITNNIFKANLNTISLNFIHLLIRNRRESYLKNICHYYISYHKRKMGIQEAVITTAKSLKKEHSNEILSYLNSQLKNTIELTEKTDPNIIGGFILQIEDQQINASIRGQLDKIKRELINK